MFVEEAKWVNSVLEKITEENLIIGNLGSSTLEFRMIHQPHIQDIIINPLAERKHKIYNIDFKNGNGIEIVDDITDPGFGPKYFNFFDIVLCTNMLEHVENIPVVIKNLIDITKPGKYILITVPRKYHLHFDPIDNGFRPTPKELLEYFKKCNYQVVSQKIISINQLKAYKFKKSKWPLWGYREKIKYFFGQRYKVTGILLKLKK